MHRSIRYSLATFKDCTDHDGKSITAFTIRTTDGEDETYASKRAESKGTGMSEELIRFSMVTYEIESDDLVDGKSVTKVIDIKHPFESFDKWSTKARNFVVAAWKRISTPNDLEIADFFGSATEIG